VTTPRATPSHQAPTRRIASWRPASVAQRPGHLCSVIELWGCSFTCPGCHGLRSAGAETEVPGWDEIVTQIGARRGMLDSVVVTGGEPLEDPDLPSLLAALSELGLDVCLETNGSRPDVLSVLLAEALVAFVALDVKTVPARYREVSDERDMPARVAECTDMLIRSGVAHEFRTTADPGLVTPTDLTSIARTLQGGSLYALQLWAPGEGDVGAPFDDGALLEAAGACQCFLPTIVRGLGPREG
jgi:pyruvate formate lyase activating enzyme